MWMLSILYILISTHSLEGVLQRQGDMEWESLEIMWNLVINVKTLDLKYQGSMALFGIF